MPPSPVPSRHALFDKPYLLLSLTSLFWAINIVLGRFVAGQIPPVTLSCIRWFGASVFLMPFAWRHLKRDWPIIRAQFPLMTLLAATGISAYNTMAYWGLQYTQALNGLLIQSTAPLLIALWTLVLFRDRLTLAQFLGILTSLAGVVVIVCRGDLGLLLSLDLNIGDAWVFGALVFYGFYSALLRRRPALHPLSFLSFTILWGAILLLPFLAWEIGSGARMHVTPATLGVCAYVMTFPSLVAYLFFNRGVELIGANRAGPFFHLMPLFGAVIAIVFLGERPHLFHAGGFALILCGVVVATRGRRAAVAAKA